MDFLEGIQTSDFSVKIEVFTDKSGKCRKNFTRTGKPVTNNTGRARTAAESDKRDVKKGDMPPSLDIFFEFHFFSHHFRTSSEVGPLDFQFFLRPESPSKKGLLNPELYRKNIEESPIFSPKLKKFVLTDCLSSPRTLAPRQSRRVEARELSPKLKNAIQYDNSESNMWIGRWILRNRQINREIFGGFVRCIGE
ncbi:MAG: hypothetical protein GY714_18435 [Desulfobacterales bacterium]|nr:hypothetical protein [Desulfobacterales bacterium]